MRRAGSVNVGSLFSGIGGFDLGLERAGMTVKWQVEIDPYCQRVLAKHWPDVKRYGDIKTIDWSEVEKVDLICGGFPCQPVSYAGKRLAQDDPRWLWPEVERCVRVLRPRFALMENVPGLLSAGMSDVLGDLAALGYDAEWNCIRASQFGAWHRRERCFVVAYPDSFRREILSESILLASESSMQSGFWQEVLVPSRLQRVVNGIPEGLDRLRGLGNAVVPQVAEWIGQRIMAVTA